MAPNAQDNDMASTDLWRSRRVLFVPIENLSCYSTTNPKAVKLSDGRVHDTLHDFETVTKTLQFTPYWLR